MNLYRMKMVDSSNDAYALAVDKPTAIAMFKGKFGVEPELSFKVNTSGTTFLTDEVEEEREA